jgi:hypothetical protein
VVEENIALGNKEMVNAGVEDGHIDLENEIVVSLVTQNETEVATRVFQIMFLLP